MGEIAPQEQFLPFSTIFYYLMLDFSVKTGIRLSLQDKRLFEITEVQITRVNCILKFKQEMVLLSGYESEKAGRRTSISNESIMLKLSSDPLGQYNSQVLHQFKLGSCCKAGF